MATTTVRAKKRKPSGLHKSVRYAEPGALEDDVKTGWRSLLALQSRFVALKKEFEAAIFAFHRDQSEENLSYINQLHNEINALGGRWPDQ